MLREQREQGIISEGEFRKGMIDKIITFFEKAHIFEKSQEILKAERIKDVITFEEFRDFLIRVNGVVREIPIKDREVDPEWVVVKSSVKTHNLPKPSDKNDLFKKVYDCVDKVKKQDLQYFVPLMINAIHLFKDGNGRTARIFYLLLKDLISRDDFIFELEKAIDIDAAYTVPNINPGHISYLLDRFLLQRHGIDSWKHVRVLNNNIKNSIRPCLVTELSNDKSKLFLREFNDDRDMWFLAVYEYLLSDGRINEFMIPDGDGINIIDMKLIDEKLSDNDWGEIESRYYSYKKEFVEMLIDLFINSDNYPVEPHSPINLKDLLITRINRQKE